MPMLSPADKSNKKTGVLGMILKFNKWYGSASGLLLSIVT